MFYWNFIFNFLPVWNLSTDFYMDCVTFWSLAFASRRSNKGLELVGLFVFLLGGMQEMLMKYKVI